MVDSVLNHNIVLFVCVCGGGELELEIDIFNHST